MLKYVIVLVINSFFIVGCAFYSEPKEKIEFSHATRVEDLIGTYKNAGDPNSYLSQLIWGYNDIKINSKNIILKHEDIELIQVLLKKEKLVVHGIKNKCSFYEREYELGKDIDIKNGEIILYDKHFYLYSPGSAVLGPSHEKKIIGLDKKGHGIYKSEATIMGLAYFIIPMAASNYSEIRFKRLINIEIFSDCL